MTDQHTSPRAWTCLATVLVVATAALAPATRARAAEPCGPPVSQPTRNVDGVPSGLAEASGFVASQRYPGVAWAHQDSGHDASLFALRIDDNGRATSMRQIPVQGAKNTDWEDLSYEIGPDGTGRLYVVESGDFGPRVIYEIREPDPDIADGGSPGSPSIRPSRPANHGRGFLHLRWPPGPRHQELPCPGLPLRRPAPGRRREPPRVPW